MPDFGGGGGDQAAAYQQAGAGQAEAARYAADLQYKASQESNALIKEMYQTGRADLAPWRASGQIALDIYSGLLGLPSMYSTKLPQVPGQEYPKADTSKTGTGTGTTGNVLLGGGGFVYDPDMGIWTPYADKQKFYQDERGNLYPESMIQKYPKYDRGALGQMLGEKPTGYSYIATTKDGSTVEVNPTGGSPVGPSASMTGGTPQTGTPGQTNANVLADYSRAAAAPSNRLNATEWVKQTPGYDFQFSEGVNALDRSAASRGMMLSGAQGRGLQEYGQNFALGHYNTLMDRLASMAGIGQSTAAQTGQMGQNMAAQSAQNTMTAAQNAGQARMAGAEAIGSGYINAANAAQSNQNSTMNTLMSLPTAAYGLWKLGSGVASLFSDKRTKRNITPVDFEALPIIQNLKAVMFEYLPEWGGGPEQAGFIADDLETILPGSVIHNENGIRMVNPLPVMALLVKALQEQQTEINELRRAQ